jgi:hypothetical protein
MKIPNPLLIFVLSNIRRILASAEQTTTSPGSISFCKKIYVNLQWTITMISTEPLINSHRRTTLTAPKPNLAGFCRRRTTSTAPKPDMAEFCDAGLAKNCQIYANLSDIESQALASSDLSFLRRVSLSLTRSLSAIESDLGLRRIRFGGSGCVGFHQWSRIGVWIVVGRHARQQFQI